VQADQRAEKWAQLEIFRNAIPSRVSRVGRVSRVSRVGRVSRVSRLSTISKMNIIKRDENVRRVFLHSYIYTYLVLSPSQ
jgi:hypothetical protein